MLSSISGRWPIHAVLALLPADKQLPSHMNTCALEICCFWWPAAPSLLRVMARRCSIQRLPSHSLAAFLTSFFFSLSSLPYITTYHTNWNGARLPALLQCVCAACICNKVADIVSRALLYFNSYILLAFGFCWITPENGRHELWHYYMDDRDGSEYFIRYVQHTAAEWAEMNEEEGAKLIGRYDEKKLAAAQYIADTLPLHWQLPFSLSLFALLLPLACDYSCDVQRT